MFGHTFPAIPQHLATLHLKHYIHLSMNSILYQMLPHPADHSADTTELLESSFAAFQSLCGKRTALARAVKSLNTWRKGKDNIAAEGRDLS